MGEGGNLGDDGDEELGEAGKEDGCHSTHSAVVELVEYV